VDICPVAPEFLVTPLTLPVKTDRLSDRHIWGV